MASIDILLLIGGGLLTTCIGLLAFFAQRLLTQYDEFQKETSGNFRSIGQSLRDHDYAISQFKFEVGKRLEDAGLSEAQKRKISQIQCDITKMQETLNVEVLPLIRKADDNFGKVIVIEKRVAAQDEKLLTMFKALEQVVRGKR